MKVKILLSAIALTVLIMLIPPVVEALPGDEKTNGDFISLEINKVGGPPVGPVEVILHPAPPAEAQFRRAIVPEGLRSAEIIIADNTYTLGVHFNYISTITMDFHLNSDPVFCTMTVECSYVFIPETSGIDGALEVRTDGRYWPNGRDGVSPSDSWGFSVGHGTGDLEGVLLKATGWQTGLQIRHEGYVTNWPTTP